MKREVDWRAVEAALRRSVEGRARPEDLDLFEPAYRSDPERYRALHARVKDEAIERVRGGFG